jgi:hypothetical protein
MFIVVSLDVTSCSLVYTWNWIWRTRGVWRHATVVQDVPLATKPGISLTILTPIKILQGNLNRSTFVVWEMWHHNMCWKWPPFASRQDWTRYAIFWKDLVSTSAVTAWTINTRLSTVYRYIFQLSCVNSQFTLNSRTTTALCRHPQANDREISREARQARNRLASWRTAAPCPNNEAHYRHIHLYFSHNERTPVQISLQHLYWC